MRAHCRPPSAAVWRSEIQTPKSLKKELLALCSKPALCTQVCTTTPRGSATSSGCLAHNGWRGVAATASTSATTAPTAARWPPARWGAPLGRRQTPRGSPKPAVPGAIQRSRRKPASGRGRAGRYVAVGNHHRTGHLALHARTNHNVRMRGVKSLGCDMPGLLVPPDSSACVHLLLCAACCCWCTVARGACLPAVCAVSQGAGACARVPCMRARCHRCAAAEGVRRARQSALHPLPPSCRSAAAPAAKRLAPPTSMTFW